MYERTVVRELGSPESRTGDGWDSFHPALIELSVRGSTPYAAHHSGWHHTPTGLLVTRSGEFCTAERRIPWHKGSSCEIEHTTLSITETECRDLFACVQAALPSDLVGLRMCGNDGNVIVLDGDESVVELSSGGGYRGCEWVEPPECVAQTFSRLIWPRNADAGPAQ